MITLRDKFRGCIAASRIGSAMGAVTEGWAPEDIKRQFGYLEELRSYKHYPDLIDWQRAPGTTEDGIERQKLFATAIIEKKDRILAEDLIRVWVRDLKPDTIIYKQERFDKSLLELARAGVPPSDLGQLWLFPNVIAMARASHPIGLINAGDPEGAADDSIEAGKVYARETAFALRWAALYNAAIAEACKPGATVESVIDTARRFAAYRAASGTLYALYDTIESDLNHALGIAARHTDPLAMRDEFYQRYQGGNYFNYGMSQANEIVSKGLAVFAIVKGNPRDAITLAVNFGRDTDCLAAVAGGLAGALSGTAQIPAEWINQVNRATEQDPYTNSHLSIEATADGLFEAYLNRRRKLQETLDKMNPKGYLA